jgi:hypothetical protein
LDKPPRIAPDAPISRQTAEKVAALASSIPPVDPPKNGDKKPSVATCLNCPHGTADHSLSNYVWGGCLAGNETDGYCPCQKYQTAAAPPPAPKPKPKPRKSKNQETAPEKDEIDEL